MEAAIQMITASPEKAIAALLKDAASRKQIVKKLSKLVNKGKISPNVNLKSNVLKRVQKSPTCPQRTKTNDVWKLSFSSPAIESRVQDDPYDDRLMGDFGILAELFYNGETQDQLHKSQQKAVEAAWSFARQCIDSDIDEDEFREELVKQGYWCHEGDFGADLVIELQIANIK